MKKLEHVDRIGIWILWENLNNLNSRVGSWVRGKQYCTCPVPFMLSAVGIA